MEASNQFFSEAFEISDNVESHGMNPWTLSAQEDGEDGFYDEAFNSTPTKQILPIDNSEAMFDESLMAFLDWECQWLSPTLNDLCDSEAETPALQYPHIEDENPDSSDLAMQPISTFTQLLTTPKSLPIPEIQAFPAHDTYSLTFNNCGPYEQYKTPRPDDPSSSTPRFVTKKSRTLFPPTALKILQYWLETHQENPYPSRVEKADLTRRSGLTTRQVNTWFANARQKLLDPMMPCISSSLEEEVMPVEDIRLIAARIPFRGSKAALNSSPDSDSGLSSPGNLLKAICSSPQSIRTAEFSSASSVSSVLDQYPQGMLARSRRKGRKKYKVSLSTSCNSLISLSSSIENASEDLSVFALRGVKRHHQDRAAESNLEENYASNLRTIHQNLEFTASEASSALTLQPSKPQPRHDLPKITFQCTFCHSGLSEKAWRRHEESQHVLRRQWTCMWNSDPFVPSPSCDSLSICVMCRLTIRVNSEFSSKEDHIKTCSNRVADCLDRSAEERTYSRKDHLVQHVQQFHNTTLNRSEVDRWESVNEKLNRPWGCGFCGAILPDWNTREAHIAVHFRQGLNMNDWDSSRTAPKTVRGEENDEGLNLRQSLLTDDDGALTRFNVSPKESMDLGKQSSSAGRGHAEVPLQTQVPQMYVLKPLIFLGHQLTPPQ